MNRNDVVEQIAEVLRQDGWTCEYHEPVSGHGECSQCDDAHRHTAERVAEALQLTEEVGIQATDAYGNPVVALWPDGPERRWVSAWSGAER